MEALDHELDGARGDFKVHGQAQMHALPQQSCLWELWKQYFSSSICLLFLQSMIGASAAICNISQPKLCHYFLMKLLELLISMYACIYWPVVDCLDLSYCMFPCMVGSAGPQCSAGPGRVGNCFGQVREQKTGREACLFERGAH